MAPGGNNQRTAALLLGKATYFCCESTLYFTSKMKLAVCLGLHGASLIVKAMRTRRSTLTDGRTLLSLWLILSSNGSAPVLLWRPFCLNTMWTSFIRPNFALCPPHPIACSPNQRTYIIVSTLKKCWPISHLLNQSTHEQNERVMHNAKKKKEKVCQQRKKKLCHSHGEEVPRLLKWD